MLYRNSTGRRLRPTLSLTVLLLLPALAGCSNGLSGLVASETPAPVTSDSLPRIPRVSNSTQSPCWQQREIAKQNAWFASRAAQKPILIEAPCDVDKPKAEPPPTKTPPGTT